MENWKEAVRIFVEEGNYEEIDKLVSERVEKKIRRSTVSYREIEDIKQEVHLKMLKGEHWKKLYDTDANDKMIKKYVGMTIDSILKDRRKKRIKPLPLNGQVLPYDEDYEEKILIDNIKQKLKDFIKDWKNETQKKIAEAIIDGKELKIIAREMKVSPSLVTYVKKNLIFTAKNFWREKKVNDD